MAEFWTAALALTVFLYIKLDGVDLGVGILFAFARTEACKRQMLQSVSPVWDGNETWLIISAAILFGAFPIVYSLLLSAFYIPLMLMLGGLILRGVAFEFRAHSGRSRKLWDAGFYLGSTVAAFAQGCAVGALVLGLPNQDGRFTGGPLFWLQPFALLCGAGLCLGYAMLAAAWLIRKTEGSLHDRSVRQFRGLLLAFLICLAVIFFLTIRLEQPVANRWTAHPALALIPAFGVAGALLAVAGLRGGHDAWPLIGGMMMFTATFAALATSFLPYMVPYSITYAQAAAPHASLAFLFWFAGIVVLPLTVAYGIINFVAFWGKISPEDDHHY